jgi:hypothetical protein
MKWLCLRMARDITSPIVPALKVEALQLAASACGAASPLRDFHLLWK